MVDFRRTVDVNHETELGATLLMASGFFFYVTMSESIVGALLVATGAWAMILPRFLGSDDLTSWSW